MAVAGHLWTVAGHLRRRVVVPVPPPSIPWSATVEDPAVGPIRLSGRLAGDPRASGLVILVHGLGGCAESRYLHAAARATQAAGLASLRLNLRGADRTGEDFYHAGLVDDLEAAIASPELAGYERLLLWGFSMGGHVVLRYGIGRPEARICGVAAVCPPLDLAATAGEIDRPGAWPYRRYVLRHLIEIYAAVASRRPVPTPLERVRRVRRIREFDGLTVAPRYGFRDVEDYYRTASAGPLLSRLQVPALLVIGEDDPMVPLPTLRPWLDRLPTSATARILPGGHVAFPRTIDLGHGSARLDTAVAAWLAARD